MVVAALAGSRACGAEHRFPDHLGRPYPTAFVHLDPRTGLTGAPVVRAMLDGEPSVAVMGFSDPQVVRADVRILSDDEATRSPRACGRCSEPGPRLAPPASTAQARRAAPSRDRSALSGGAHADVDATTTSSRSSAAPRGYSSVEERMQIMQW